MDFSKQKCRILRIIAKYECFNASSLFFNEIRFKLAEIETDLSAGRSIRAWLVINIGRDIKYNALMPLVERTIACLETIVASVNERIERLEEIRNSLDDECDADDILQWMLYI